MPVPAGTKTIQGKKYNLFWVRHCHQCGQSWYLDRPATKKGPVICPRCGHRTAKLEKDVG